MITPRKSVDVWHSSTVALVVLAAALCSCTSRPVQVRTYMLTSPQAAGPTNWPSTTTQSPTPRLSHELRPTGTGASALQPTPHPDFAVYDHLFVALVEERWKALIGQVKPEVRGKTGAVVVEFKLGQDGQVTDLVVTKDEVGEPFGSLGKQAITELAPFPRWPNRMRQLVGKDYREITFSFTYR